MTNRTLFKQICRGFVRRPRHARIPRRRAFVVRQAKSIIEDVESAGRRADPHLFVGDEKRTDRNLVDQRGGGRPVLLLVVSLLLRRGEIIDQRQLFVTFP